MVWLDIHLAGVIRHFQGPLEVTVAIAADYAGFPFKEAIKADLEAAGHEVLDLGAYGTDSVDYPDYGHALAEAILAGRAERGIAVCGTGIGIAMAANRHPGIRAGVCHSVETARLAREHNDANVLALGARITDIGTARACVQTFLVTAFEGGRHVRRVAKIERNDAPVVHLKQVK
ncbi:MAG TPA: ribose 5-phosphate isomerase B [Alphaproteobacteria bacterium]|jgi:ribose 5-phosphate isomerase B|nr:ribose 5-phosphate isomerase B [Alphaproteobacteria bacterium]